MIHFWRIIHNLYNSVYNVTHISKISFHLTIIKYIKGFTFIYCLCKKEIRHIGSSPFAINCKKSQPCLPFGSLASRHSRKFLDMNVVEMAHETPKTGFEIHNPKDRRCLYLQAPSLRNGWWGKGPTGRKIVDFPSLSGFVNRHPSNLPFSCKASTKVINLLAGSDSSFFGEFIIVQTFGMLVDEIQ